MQLPLEHKCDTNTVFQKLENYFGRKLFVRSNHIPYISKLIARLIKYNQHTLPKENKPFKLLQPLHPST